MRLVMLVVALGLIVPIVPAAAANCQSCAKSAATTCDTVEAPADSCCSAREAPAEDEPVEDEGDDCGFCTTGCDCSCCGSAMTVPVMHRPVPLGVSILASAPAVVWLAALSPQDAAIELLHPPQT